MVPLRPRIAHPVPGVDSVQWARSSGQGPQQRRESILAAIPQLVDRFDLGAPVRKVGLRVTNLSHPGKHEAQRTLLDFVEGGQG